jgi:hypothetical protein
MKTIERGATVNIYQDPISGEKLEGKARLIRQTHEDTGDGLSIWLVAFLDEQGAFNEFSRTVNAANAFD